MRNINKIISVLTLLLFSTSVFSQKDSTLVKEVEVIKAYQPSITDAIKINTSPKITDTANYSPVFEYKISSTLIPVKKTITKLPVVQLGNPPKTHHNTGFLKGGIGNAYTPYAEIFVNTSPTKTTDFGLHLFHYSAWPSVKLNNELRVKTPYSQNTASIFMKNYFKRAVLEWNINYDRNRFDYYGFPGTDSLLYRDTEKLSSTLNKKQVFNNAYTNFRLRSLSPRSKFVHNTLLGYNYFWNTTGQNSHHGYYDGSYSLEMKKFNLLLDSKVDYIYQDSTANCYSGELSSHQFIYEGLSPAAEFNWSNIYLKAGFNLAGIFDDDSSATLHISPNINFEYYPIKNVLTLFAGSNGKLSSNHYQMMAEINPYINPYQELRPSQEYISFFGGFKGKISRKIAYLIDVNYSINGNNPFYYLKMVNYANGSKDVVNVFGVKYSNLNTLRFGGNIRYSSENINIALAGNYYNHSADDIQVITHLPSFDVTLSTSVQITEKIKATLDASVIGPRKGEVEICTYKYKKEELLIDNPVYTTEYHDLKTIIDVNLGGEYQFSNKLNFFLNVSNLLNQNYEMWHGYNSQGIHFLVGARYIF
jgi:hypothetical protein